MVSPGRVLLGARRLPLTTKHGHNYYKGTGTGSTGQHRKHGGFLVDYAKVRTYPRPVNLETCGVSSNQWTSFSAPFRSL